MRNARVFLVHDDEDCRKVLKILLARREHTVVLDATNALEAQLVIYGGQVENAGCNVAIVRANLSCESEADYEGSDGKIVTEALRQDEPRVKVIAYYMIKSPEYGDVQIRETDPAEALFQAIASL